MKTPNNYGELIAAYTGGTLWSYNEYGSYQGDYVAIIYKDSSLLIYKGEYGSCSGCDWMQDQNEEITDEDVKEYMKNAKPFLEIPAASFPQTEEDLAALLPANTRTWLDDGFTEFKLKDILEQIKNPTVKNLDLVENEAKNKGLI